MKHLVMAALIAVATVSLGGTAFAAFGAIALNKSTGAYGYSYDYATRQAAERAARNNCEGRCQIVMWVRNSCAALSIGDNLAWGTGNGASRSQAIASADRQCQAVGRGCGNAAWVCSG